MKIQHLQGLISAPFTPFDSNGKLDVSLIPGYYSFLNSLSYPLQIVIQSRNIDID